jgi:hypothetical protein
VCDLPSKKVQIDPFTAHENVVLPPRVCNNHVALRLWFMMTLVFCMLLDALFGCL